MDPGIVLGQLLGWLLGYFRLVCLVECLLTNRHCLLGSFLLACVFLCGVLVVEFAD